MTTLTNFIVNNQLTIMDASLNVINIPFSSLNNYEYYNINTLGRTYIITSNYNISKLNYALTGAGGNGYQGKYQKLVTPNPNMILYGGAGGGSGGLLRGFFNNFNVGNTISVTTGTNVNRNSKLVYQNIPYEITGGKDGESNLANQGGGTSGTNGTNGTNATQKSYYMVKTGSTQVL